MKYLCLIHLDEQKMADLPEGEMNRLDIGHLDLNDELRDSGHFIEAEALEPASTTVTLRRKNGKVAVTDGPFAETKELVAGFYLIEAHDMDEAIGIAARFPGGQHGVVEVRGVRALERA